MNNFAFMIDHEGIIESIEGDVAHVKISTVSACASCHAKGACSAADQEDKYLDVPVDGLELNRGERVHVQVAGHLGLKAVALGYIYPFLILMAVLIGLTLLNMNELKAGLFALLSIIPYYLVLFLLKDRMERVFTFSIKKNSSV
jgi:sigma-E factor negative regulatory protein RseC